MKQTYLDKLVGKWFENKQLAYEYYKKHKNDKVGSVLKIPKMSEICKR